MVDRVEGVIRLERVLEYGLNFASVLHPVVAGHSADVDSLIQDAAAGGFQYAEHQSCERCFAAAALAGDGSDGWTVARNAEGYVVKCERDIGAAEDAAAEFLADMLQLQ